MKNYYQFPCIQHGGISQQIKRSQIGFDYLSRKQFINNPDSKKMNHGRLSELINGALRNTNNVQRAKAEGLIIQWRAQQTVSFFIGCAELFIDSNCEEFVRRSAAALLSRSTSLRTNANNNPYFWDILPADVKTKIKEMVLSTLICPNQDIMRDAANVISHIAVVEIPRGQWLDIAELLAQNTQHSDLNVRKASVITIGRICEQLNFFNSEVDARTCQQFLGGIIIGSREKQNLQIVEESIKALGHSLAFLKPIIGEALYRDQIFKLLYENLNSEEYGQSCYEALEQFCKSAYDFLDSYLNPLLQILISHIQQRSDNALRAMEVLDTIATYFHEKVQQQEGRTYESNNFNLPNYLTPLQNRLMPEIMSCLLIENQDDLDFPQMRNSAAKALSTIVAIGNHQTINIILNGVSTIVQANNIGHQQGSAILLSTICQFPDKIYAQNCIFNNFDQVLPLLTSTENIVLLNTLNGLSLISESFPNIFLNHKFIKDIIDKLFGFLTMNNIPISTAVLTIFRNFTEKVDSNSLLISDPSILLTKLVNFYEAMLQNYDGPNKDYSEKVVISIMNCLMKTRSRQTLVFMIDFLITKYQDFFQKNITDLEIILQSILSIMNTSILALENTVPKHDLMNRIISVIDNHIRRFGIEDEGINMISCMVVVFSKNFQKAAQKYWPHVLHGLQALNQPKVFRASIQCVGDYSRVYTETFADKQNEIMSRLLSLIHQNIDRTLKSYILSCIGDLALGLGCMTEGYIEQIIKVCDLCFEAVYELSSNPNDKQYVEQLKKSLIDMYACVSFAMNSRNQRSRSINHLILQHFPFMATFVVRTCSRQQDPSIDYLKSCLYLIFDTVSFFWSNESNRPYLVQVIQNDSIKGLVRLLDNFSQQEQIRELQVLIQQRYTCAS